MENKPQLTLSVLGTFQLKRCSQWAVTVRTVKARALLAYLLLESAIPQPRDVIATLLWPEKDHQAARHNLRQTLSLLRDALKDTPYDSDLLLADQTTIQKNPAVAVEIDVVRIEQLLTACRLHEHTASDRCAACAERYEQIIDLYHGPFLVGLDVTSCVEFDVWITYWRERLHRQVLRVLYLLTAYYEWQGDYLYALSFAQRQIALEGWREEAYQQKMRLLLRMGERSAALRAYENCRYTLQSEFGADVSAETNALHQHAQNFTKLVLLPPPYFSAELRHRHAELSMLQTFLNDPQQRLLTICGVQETGKTHLATAYVQTIQAGRFLNGVHFIRFDSLHTIEMLFEQFDPACLHHHEMLIVLDGADYIPLLANWIAAILQRAPHIKLIVTVRQPLKVQHEQLLWIEDIRPNPAIQLFQDAISE